MKNKELVLSIDIGGTKIYSAKINKEGDIIGEIEKDKTPKTSNEIFNLLSEIIKKNENDVTGVSIATAGAVNNENNRVISATGNLPSGYRDIEFSKLSKKRVFIENDANCAAYAEFKTGSAKGFLNSITITLGTGVGGGIIVGGHLLKGKSGSAGEMHFKMSTKKVRKCTCGAWDCFEIYTSGKGLTLTAKEVTGKDLTTYEIIELWKNGDKNALSVINRWEEDIIAGFIGLGNIFDPDCIVLSGSMADFVNTKKIEERVNSEISTQPLRILKASAGNYSGMIGAALLMFDMLR